MNRILSLIALLLVLYAGALLYGFWAFDGFFPSGLYIFNDAILLLIAFFLAISAFVAHRRSREKLAKLTLVCGAILFAIAALDLYVVSFRFDSSGPGGADSFTHMNWYRTYVHNNDGGYWAPPLEPFRNEDERPETVIAVVGDSFTWGQGVRGRDLRYSEQLEALLNHDGNHQIRVLNFGAGGTGTLLQTKYVLPDVRQIRPDIVLIGYLTNDIEDQLGLVRIEYEHMPQAVKLLGRAIPFVNFVYWWTAADFSQQAERSFFAWISAYRDPDNYAAHAKDLEAMVAEIRSIPARPVVAILPYPQMWQPFQPSVRDQIHGALTDSLGDLDVPVIPLGDLEQRFPPGEIEVNAMDGHPNQTVHRAIAERLADWFRANPCYLRSNPGPCED